MAATAAPHANRQFGIHPAEGVGAEPDAREKFFFGVDETCHALGVRMTTVYDLIAAGKLKKVKLGRRTLIPAESVRALVASLSEAA